MANVQTAIAPDPTWLPLTGFPEPVADRENVAVRILEFRAFEETIAATGAGDNQTVSFTANLPRDFAYVWLYGSIQIARSGTNNFTDNGEWQVRQGQGTGTELATQAGIATANQGASATQNVNFRPDAYYPSVIVASTSGDAQVRFSVRNGTAQDNAYTGSGSIVVAQYTIDQAFHFLINTPQYTRGC